MPIGPKITLLVILDFLSSKCDYEIAWPSITTIAEVSGLSARAVRRHVKALRELGLLTVIPCGRQAITRVLKQKYSYALGLTNAKHRLNFYKICWKHSLWDGIPLSENDLTKVSEQGRGRPHSNAGQGRVRPPSLKKEGGPSPTPSPNPLLPFSSSSQASEEIEAPPSSETAAFGERPAVAYGVGWGSQDSGKLEEMRKRLGLPQGRLSSAQQIKNLGEVLKLTSDPEAVTWDVIRHAMNSDVWDGLNDDSLGLRLSKKFQEKLLIEIEIILEIEKREEESRLANLPENKLAERLSRAMSLDGVEYSIFFYPGEENSGDLDERIAYFIWLEFPEFRNKFFEFDEGLYMATLRPADYLSESQIEKILGQFHSDLMPKATEIEVDNIHIEIAF